MAVDGRTREIATLSAIGYDPLPIAVSVVLEGVILSLCGALAGASIAHILLDGRLEIIWNADQRDSGRERHIHRLM